ncbi:hypothetical protein A3K73_03900 [Candidatus Pacearchaeota archaeon RBG_13_36_9]|nr:MAG: hypothetical protein A3K73_03900 [Candidatus Pacearchaeota archaeon RBG_13_36_9]
MPLYDMHCSNPECSYVGEYLLKHRDETLKCPRCKEGELVRNAVQKFNVGGGNGKSGLLDVSVSSKSVCLPAYSISPSGIHGGYALGKLIAVKRNQAASKN